MRRILAALGLGIAAACSKAAPPPPAPPPGPPPIDEAAAKQGVEALWARTITADTAGNADALLAQFTDNVRLDMQGMPAIIGKAALGAAMKPMMAAHHSTGYQYAAGTTQVVTNDLVYQGGTYEETYIEKKKTRVEYGRYASAIAKDSDGQWKFAYWMAIVDSTVAKR